MILENLPHEAENGDYIIENSLTKTLDNALYMRGISKSDRDYFLELFNAQTPENMISFKNFQKKLIKNLSTPSSHKFESYIFAGGFFAALNGRFKDNIVLYRYIKQFEEKVSKDKVLIQMNNTIRKELDLPLLEE